MLNVIRMEDREGVNSGRTVVASFDTQNAAEEKAKSLSEEFKHNGFRGERKYYWGRNDEGPKFIFFVAGG